MVVLSKAILKEFAEKYPDSRLALEKWYDEVKKADWGNFTEVKTTFNTTDAVGKDRYVFNIRGNHYRLIALIIFKVRTVFILFIGTHAEYNKIDAATITFK
jgi:mRNA interferase HigB